MAGVLCVWANLPEDSIEWYENEFVPKMRTQNAVHALHSELTQSGFEGQQIGQLDSPWPLCTLYEVKEIRKATDDCYDKRNHPPEELLAGPLAQARFDTRTYREVKRWQAEDWEGDVADVDSVAVMEWRIPAEREAEVIEWYKSYAGPVLSSSPATLRLRMFEIDNATVLEGTSYQTKNKDSLHSYLTIVELGGEDWPWEAIFELSENEQWKEYFENQTVVKWQISHYLIKRLYTESDPKGTGESND